MEYCNNNNIKNNTNMITLGDQLQHSNPLFSITDITDSRGGIRSVTTFNNTNLNTEFSGIPDKLKTGHSLLLETSTNRLYYLSGTPQQAIATTGWTITTANATLQQVTLAGASTPYPISITVPDTFDSSLAGLSVSYLVNTDTTTGENIAIGIDAVGGSIGVRGIAEIPGNPNFDSKGVYGEGKTGIYGKGLYGVWGDGINGGFGLLGTSTNVAIKAEAAGFGIAGIFNISGGTQNIMEFKKAGLNQAYVTHNGNFVSNKLLVNTTVDNGIDVIQSQGSILANLPNLGLQKIAILGVNNNTGSGGYFTGKGIEGRGSIGVSAIGLGVFGTGLYAEGSGSGAIFNKTSDQSGYVAEFLYQSNPVARINSDGTFTANSDAVINELTIGKGAGNYIGNTVLGLNALTTNVGANNTAIGNDTLRFNTTGNNNLAVGFRSLRLNTTGFENTAAGIDSLHSNTIGSANTTMGSGSLFNNTVGIRNSAYGYYALRANVLGNENTAVGYRALRFNTGNSNIGVGNDSLYNNTIGGSNIAIGDNAGALIANKIDPATILDNSIMIGYRTSPNASNQTNQIVIGHDGIGLGSNTTSIGNTSTLTTAIYGNLLVGTTVDNGVDRLQVTGAARISQDSIINGINIGRGGGNISGNTRVGEQALLSNTTGGSNTATGVNSLYSNTDGNNNTANGAYALQGNTTGFNNTANGVQALYSNTTGNTNTANGAAALFNNTTGSSNTATGVNSLYSNTTGANNTANGMGALFSNTTGSGSTAIGINSLYGNTTGAFNTAIGRNSLQSNTQGSSNTAIGSTALAANTNGGNNVAIGRNSMSNNTGGSSNVSIGESTSNGTANDVNSIVIGQGATGLGTNTVVLGNNAIVLTALRGQIAIGTTAPEASARVQIDSTTQGFLPSRMTTTQINAILSPANGLLIYNTTIGLLCFYNGTSWQRVTSSVM